MPLRRSFFVIGAMRYFDDPSLLAAAREKYSLWEVKCRFA